MEENIRLEKHCHMSNSSFDTLTNRVRGARRKAQRKKSPGQLLSILYQLGCEKTSGRFTFRSISKQFSQIFWKIFNSSRQSGPCHEGQYIRYSTLQDRKVRLKIWAKIRAGEFTTQTTPFGTAEHCRYFMDQREASMKCQGMLSSKNRLNI